MTAIRRVAWATAALTYALVVMGALVRATNSGLSCPDWPTCYGRWVLTPAEFAALPYTGYSWLQVMLEWGHRLVAGVLLGPLVLLLAGLTVRYRRERPALLVGAAVLIGLLLVQKLLGGITVLDRNSPWSVALHLGNALLVLSAVLWIATRAQWARQKPVPGRVRALAALAWALAILAMTSAAVTAKSGASLACPAWPLCEDSLVPALDDPLVRAHLAHRALALAVALVLVALWRATRRAPADVRRLADVALGLVAAQVALGALVVLWQVPIWSAVLHQAVGVLTFAVITVLLWRSRPQAAAVVDREGGHGLALRGA